MQWRFLREPTYASSLGLLKLTQLIFVFSLQAALDLAPPFAQFRFLPAEPTPSYTFDPLASG
ncbi:protein of unknown function [Hyphomicrobium sp. 1Nfss2.1]